MSPGVIAPPLQICCIRLSAIEWLQALGTDLWCCAHISSVTLTQAVEFGNPKVRLLLPRLSKFQNSSTMPQWEIEYQPYRITSGIIHLGSSVLHGHVAFAIRPEGIWLVDENRKGQWIPQFTFSNPCSTPSWCGVETFYIPQDPEVQLACQG